ncbi:MAG: hypothetical protein GY771_14775 [bacterium]|nr:hypothetical protein [bacterium]
MKPQRLQTAGLLMFISGIINVVYAGMMFLTFFFLIAHAAIMIGTFSSIPEMGGDGAPFPLWIFFVFYAVMFLVILVSLLYFLIVGIMEIKNGNLLRADEDNLEKAPITVSVLGIVCFVLGNQISGILEIIALVFMTEGDAKKYFDGIVGKLSGKAN